MNLGRFARAPYRVGQVFAVRRARTHPPDPEAVAAILPEPLHQIFRAMPPEDQSHGMAVLAALTADGETDAPLLQAALLHDAGKAEAGVGVLHRSARVLLASTWPALWRRLSAHPTGWRRPFWAVAHHPERGAIWVSASGGSPPLADLVRRHEEDAPAEWSGTPLQRWHAALARADARL